MLSRYSVFNADNLSTLLFHNIPNSNDGFQYTENVQSRLQTWTQVDQRNHQLNDDLNSMGDWVWLPDWLLSKSKF